jgi:uncharacterized protein involved in exopolysaccharide biosynthesis/Mrp family chromosome partitioning ATPase
MEQTRNGESGQRAREKSLRDFYYVVFRHKWKALLFFVVVATAVTVGTFTAPEIYESQAKLLVKPGRESLAVDPTVPEGRIISISRQMEEQLNSELEILRNRILVENVVDAVGPEKLLKQAAEGTDSRIARSKVPQKMLHKVGVALRTVKAVPANILQSLGIVDVLQPREKAIQQVSKNMHVEALRKSNVIQITFESQSPELARNTLQGLIDSYLEHHVQVYQTGGSYEFFKEQTENLSSELEATEEALRTFKNTANVGALAEQRSVTIQQYGDLQRQIRDVDTQLAASEATVYYLERTLGQTPQTIPMEQVTGRPNYFMDNARLRLLELRLREKELLTKYSENSRQVRDLREQIRRAEATVGDEQPTRTERKTGINSSYQQLELDLLQERARLASLQKQKEALSKQVAATQEDLRLLNDTEMKLAQLERRRAIVEQNYRAYVDKLEETRISQGLEREKISNIAIVQPATMPILPTKPNKTLTLTIGLFLGLFGALALSLTSEHLDHSIRTPEDVQEKLQLPSLGSIPRSKLNVVHPALQGEACGKLAVKVIKAASRDWRIPERLREHYDTFLEHLLSVCDRSQQGACTIAVMGCYRGEGVSTVAANLAAALAQQDDGGVLLMDANAHHPSVHRIFGARLTPGLTDALAAGSNGGNGDKNDSPFFHRAANLDLLTAGSANGSTRKTLKPEALSQFLASAKQSYRFVVIDMPALSTDSSTVRLASMCDAAVIVVEAERLRWEVIQEAKKQLTMSQVNILGVLVNKRRFPVPEWLYRTL